MMPVHKDAEVYNMNHQKRGRALILNHEVSKRFVNKLNYRIVSTIY